MKSSPPVAVCAFPSRRRTRPLAGSGRVRISFPKAPGQEITLLTPKHEWVVAADPVMAIVGAAGLMPMDLDGERVQIQHEAAWCIPAKSPFGHGEQDRPESRAVLIAREVFQEARERGLGGEPLGSRSEEHTSELQSRGHL